MLENFPTLITYMHVKSGFVYLARFFPLRQISSLETESKFYSGINFKQNEPWPLKPYLSVLWLNSNFQQMLNKKNIAFTLLIKINGRLREYNFRKRGETFYDVDTNDERGNRYYFKMVKQEEGWKLGGDHLPGWLKENELLIHESILNKEKAA
jgi:hypothetical protein